MLNSKFRFNRMFVKLIIKYFNNPISEDECINFIY